MTTVTKTANLDRQEPQPAGTTLWATTLRFGKVLATTSVVPSIQIPRDVGHDVLHVVFIFKSPRPVIMEI